MWLGGFFLFHVSSFLIHILLIFAVISIVMHLISGRRAAQLSIFDERNLKAEPRGFGFYSWFAESVSKPY